MSHDRRKSEGVRIGRRGGGRAPHRAPLDAGAILTAVGGVAYEWTIADDRIRWGADALDVLGVASLEAIATGRDFAALLDPASTTSRHDAVLNSSGVDGGTGVSYEVQYTLLPDSGPGKKRLIIEDAGRWYAGDNGRPARARGVLRVINERAEREERRAFLTRYDELTGFFNRSHLLAVLGEAHRRAPSGSRSSIAFLIVAIDNFRAINEAYDFDIADQVFAAVGRRIRAELRDGDAIGRYSGNKLGIVLMNCSESDMHAAAERFHAVVRHDIITTETSAVAVTVSIGGVDSAAPRAHRSRGDGAGAGGAAPGAQARLRPLRRLRAVAEPRGAPAGQCGTVERTGGGAQRQAAEAVLPAGGRRRLARSRSSTRGCSASSGRTARSRSPTTSSSCARASA